jgi:hypothetical protein
MISFENNLLMNRLKIRELKFQTLSKNYSFKGLTKNDCEKCISTLSALEERFELNIDMA